MNGAMFNSLARYIDKNYPQISFSDLCGQASLKTNVFAELTWYPDQDFVKIMKALSDQTETDLTTLWREFGRETFAYFADIFGDYMNGVKGLTDLITKLNGIHHDIKRDGLGSPPRLEFKKAQPDHFEIRYSSDRNFNEFFLGMLEGATKHFQTDVKILGRKEGGKLIVTVTTKQPERVMV
ncbi:MAG: heme NO-binding domain-containing protein [Candidatus Zixiibacteriota bacterium]